MTNMLIAGHHRYRFWVSLFFLLAVPACEFPFYQHPDGSQWLFIRRSTGTALFEMYVDDDGSFSAATQSDGGSPHASGTLSSSDLALLKSQLTAEKFELYEVADLAAREEGWDLEVVYTPLGRVRVDTELTYSEPTQTFVSTIVDIHARNHQIAFEAKLGSRAEDWPLPSNP